MDYGGGAVDEDFEYDFDEDFDMGEFSTPDSIRYRASELCDEQDAGIFVSLEDFNYSKGTHFETDELAGLDILQQKGEQLSWKSGDSDTLTSDGLNEIINVRGRRISSFIQ